MAETKEQDVILRYRIEGDAEVDKLRQKNTELFKTIEANQQAINNLRAANKELSKDYAANSNEIAANKQKIAELTAVNKTYTAELNNNIKTIASGNGSLQAQRAELAQLTAEYIKLSETERTQTDAGKAMQQQIKSLSDSLKEQEKAIGDTRRNVGNYTDSIIDAGNKLGINVGFIKQAKDAYQNYAIAAQGAGKSTSVFKFALDLLAKNPIIAVIGLIVGAFMAFKKAIESSENATNKLTEAMAPFNFIMDAALSIIQKVVGVFLDMALAVSKGIAAVLDFIGVQSDSNETVKQAIELAKQKNELEKTSRNLSVENAKREKEVSELRANANDKLNFSAQQRLEFIKKANELEKQTSIDNKKLAEERLRIAEQEAARAENNAETEQKLADLRIAVYAAETSYNNKIRELKEKENSFTNEIVAERKKQADEVKKKNEENAKLQKELIEKLQAATIESMKDGKDKELATLQAAFEKEIAAIESNSKTANELRKKLQENYNNEIASIESKYTDQAIQKTIETETQKIQLRLEAIKEGSIEELNLRKQLLDQQEEAELIAAEKAGINKQLVYDKYNALRSDADQKFNDEQNAKLAERIKTENENRILELQLAGESTLNELIRQKETEISFLHKLDEESAEQFKNRQLKLSAELLELKNQQVENEIEGQKAQIESVRNVGNAFADILSIIGDNESASAGFAKALALVQIGLDTATAISKGVSASAGVPFPGNLLAITTTIAAVTANILKAKQLLAGSGKEPKVPKYQKAAVGAVVPGGQSNIDNVPFLLSGQERVVNSNSGVMFAPLLSAINQMGGGVPLAGSGSAEGEAFLTRSFAAALQLMPSPVVGVDEITRVTNQVKVIESIAKL